MLAPDNNIPDPYRPMGYSRYDYAFNNPLLYVDPTGNTFHSVAEFWQTVNDLQNSSYGGTSSGGGNITYFHSDADAFDAAATIIATNSTWGVNGTAPSFAYAQDAYYSYGGIDPGVARLNEPIIVLGNIVDKQWHTSNIFYPGQYTMDENGIVSLTLPGGEHNVGAPGFWEGIIPVWGSGRAAINDFQTGHWAWGLFNSVLAVTDVFLVKSIVTGLGKVSVKAAAKGGSSTIYRAVSQAEAADIVKFGFRIKSGGYETGKLFATTLKEAAQFGKYNFGLDGIPNTIMKVRAPNSVLNGATRFGADGMNAISIPANQLNLLKGTPLNYSPWLR